MSGRELLVRTLARPWGCAGLRRASAALLLATCMLFVLAPPIAATPDPLDPGLADQMSALLGGALVGAQAVPPKLSVTAPSVPALGSGVAGLLGLLGTSRVPAGAVPVGVMQASDATIGDARIARSPAPTRARAEFRDTRATGKRAVLNLAQTSTALLVLALAAAAFLAFESVHGRRNPRMVTAPLDRRDGTLEFE